MAWLQKLFYAGKIIRSFISANSSRLFTQSILVKHEPARASLNTIRFPLAESEAASRSMDILMINASGATQVTLTEWLCKMKHRPTIAASALEAIKLAATVHFDCVIINPEITEFDGVKFEHRLRATSLNRDLPLIALPLSGGRPLPAEAWKARGFATVLSNPLVYENLVTAMDEIAQRQSNFQEPDLESLKVAFKGLEEVAAKMVSDFLMRAPELMAKIRKAIENKDGSSLEENAHSLAGSLSYFRVERILKVSRQLERMGASGNIASAKAAYEDLSTEMALLENALKKYTGKKVA
jgi:HPt (histidine-containing phosphotransfer) domain-containing protein